MKVILKFKNGLIKHKELEFGNFAPEKFMYHQTDPEFHKYLSKMSPDKQGGQMRKLKDGISFQLSHKENDKTIYVEIP